MKFPKRLRRQGKVLATIYGKRPGRPCYRLYWRIQTPDGKPRSWMKDFGAYAEAKREGDKLVSDLARGSTVTALTPGQARDALESLEASRKSHQSPRVPVGGRFKCSSASTASSPLPHLGRGTG